MCNFAFVQNAVGIDVCVISDAFSRIPFKVDVLILPFKLFHSHKKCSNSKLFLCTTRALFDLSWHIHKCCTWKKYCVKSTLSGGPAIFVAWEKSICRSRKKNCCSRKKIFVAREKIFSARKQKYLIAWEKNTCSPVSLRPKSVLVATQRWEWNRFAKLCLKERPPCRKIAPKRSFSALASKRRPSQNYVHSWYLKLSIGNKELSEIKAWAIIEEENCSESVAWTLSLMT